MTNPAGIDLATGEGVFVSTHGGGDLSLMLEVVCRGVALSRFQVDVRELVRSQFRGMPSSCGGRRRHWLRRCAR